MSLPEGNSITVLVEGQEVRTLRDILPIAPGVRMLFVAKTPARASVKKGHYFQGAQGRIFWNRLKEYGLLRPMTEFEDDSLLDHGYGLTDIAKTPHPYGEEPSPTEYALGSDRMLKLIGIHQPKIVVFVYKKVLDQIIRLKFGIDKKSTYGFNPSLEEFFGTQVFVFPGNPCKREEAKLAMQELAHHCLGERLSQP